MDRYLASIADPVRRPQFWLTQNESNYQYLFSRVLCENKW